MVTHSDALEEKVSHDEKNAEIVQKPAEDAEKAESRPTPSGCSSGRPPSYRSGSRRGSKSCCSFQNIMFKWAPLSVMALALAYYFLLLRSPDWIPDPRPDVIPPQQLLDGIKMKVTSEDPTPGRPSMHYHINIQYYDEKEYSRDYAIYATLSTPEMKDISYHLGKLGSRRAGVLEDDFMVAVPFSNAFQRIQFYLVELREEKVVRCTYEYIHTVSDFARWLIGDWHMDPISLLVSGSQNGYKSSICNALLVLLTKSRTFREFFLTGGIYAGTRDVQGLDFALNSPIFPMTVHDSPGINIYEASNQLFIGQYMRSLEAKEVIMRSASLCVGDEGCDIQLELLPLLENREKTKEDFYDIVLFSIPTSTLSDEMAMDELIVQFSQFMQYGHSKTRYILSISGDRVPDDEQKRILKLIDEYGLGGVRTVFLETYNTATHPNNELDWNVDMSTLKLILYIRDMLPRH